MYVYFVYARECVCRPVARGCGRYESTALLNKRSTFLRKVHYFEEKGFYILYIILRKGPLFYYPYHKQQRKFN